MSNPAQTSAPAAAPVGPKWATRVIVSLGLLVTLLCVALWAGTGRANLTKFEVITEVPKKVVADDPFAETGFNDASPGQKAATEVLREQRFQFGIFPSAQSPFDKHFMSVITLTGGAWFVVSAFLLLQWRMRRRVASAGKT